VNREGWRGRHGPGEYRWGKGRNRHRPPRFFFFLFAAVFGLMALLVVGGMGIIAVLLTRLVQGSAPTAGLVWLSGCCLSLALPMMAMGIARSAFERIARPLADVMAAADAVASGDLTARVPARHDGEFGRLGKSFNRMAEELERAEQQRRNLTADVAHELRTPLHIIQGNLEGILDGVYEPTAEHIQATLEETQQLARLVEDLRTLSLAEMGQLPLVQEPVDVGELLADVVTSFSGPAEAAGVQLAVNGEAAGLVITGDAGRLDQVLSNLVANSLRYTADGGRVMLAAAALDNGVQITVEDTGEGIAAEDLPFIFDRFWRGDRARSHTAGAGSGLGLAIARQLVQAHGGRIWAESETGRGTKVVIELAREDVMRDA
jgi:two-component system OmpR family sensor kinase/two-component system sensor histidine kinase BaeS